MTTEEWRAASTCPNAATCVEVRVTQLGVQVRDGKYTSPGGTHHGPVLEFTSAEWETFLQGVKAGEFDVPGPTV
jgi:hypothetical protein